MCLTAENGTGHQERFDSESFIIGAKNHASKMIFNQRSQFISNFSPLPHQHMKGISGQIFIKGQGTIRWKIEDDGGRVHTMDTKDALYIPKQ